MSYIQPVKTIWGSYTAFMLTLVFFQNIVRGNNISDRLSTIICKQHELERKLDAIKRSQ